MTDRLNALIVVLNNDMREDDAQAIIKAIEQLRGVASVQGNVADIQSHIAAERARTELSAKLFEVIYPQRKPQ